MRPAAQLATHTSLAKDVEEGEAMTTTMDAQQLSCANLNVTTIIAAAAGNDDDIDDNAEGVGMKNSSSLSSPIEGFVVQKWMRDRTRASAPQATAGVRE